MTATKIEKIIKKESGHEEIISYLPLNDEDIVTNVLEENGEVTFELVSQDIWLKIIFQISEIGVPSLSQQYEIKRLD